MARYVVVEFADNRDAEAFIQQVNSMNEDDRKLGRPFLRRVVGVFVKPGKTCACYDWGKTNYGDKLRAVGIARGEKFGWWVCTECKKPRKAGHSLNNQLTMSDTYEGVIFDNYEFGVTTLEVTGIHTNQVNRPKKLRPKKLKGNDDSAMKGL